MFCSLCFGLTAMETCRFLRLFCHFLKHHRSLVFDADVDAESFVKVHMTNGDHLTTTAVLEAFQTDTEECSCRSTP